MQQGMFSAISIHYRYIKEISTLQCAFFIFFILSALPYFETGKGVNNPNEEDNCNYNSCGNYRGFECCGMPEERGSQAGAVRADFNDSAGTGHNEVEQ